MFEIFRMQVKQILGGRMKWLVVLCLALPVLLTLAVVATGAFREIEEELERERGYALLSAGIYPDSMRQVEWQGEDLTFMNGGVVLTEHGLTFHDNPAPAEWALIVDRGYMVLRDGALWVDTAKEPRRFSTRIERRRDTTSADRVTAAFSLDTICAAYLFLLYPQVICLLIALFYGTSVLGHELGGRTLTYLFTRPLPRWEFVVGKYGGVVAALILPTCLSLLGSWLVLGSPGGVALFGGVLAGTVGALLAYNALFVLFGFLIPRRAMIAALLYGIIFELVLSFVPALVNQFTITYYLRSLVVELLDLEVPHEAARVVGGASLPVAVLALSVMTVGALAVSSVLAAHREYVMKEEA